MKAASLPTWDTCPIAGVAQARSNANRTASSTMPLIHFPAQHSDALQIGYLHERANIA